MTITFTVPGEPKGKGRPRFTTRGSYPKAYTPAQTAAYENLVRLAYHQSFGDMMLNGAISAEVMCYFPIPKSVSKKQRQKMLEGKVWHTVKPDTDNLLKAVFDGINGIAFEDDKQIAELYCTKRYSDRPRVEITLTELEELHEEV